MVKQLKKHIKEIERFDRNRIFWLRLSGFVVISILLVIVDWAFLGVNGIYWILVSSGLVLSVVWWYWTMKLVREILSHRMIELDILTGLVSDIQEIKQDVKKLDHNG